MPRIDPRAAWCEAQTLPLCYATPFSGIISSRLSTLKFWACHSFQHHDIRSSAFRDNLVPYLGARTQHFQHEFYHFARSCYDMVKKTSLDHWPVLCDAKGWHKWQVMINRSQIYVGIGLECDSLHGRLVAVIVSFSFSQDLRVSICPVQRTEE